MNWLRTAEFKVGLMVIVVGSLIAVMSMQVSDDPSYLGRSKKAWFLLPDAGGLVKNSAVRSAGIPVGIIKDIRLQDGMARIDISLRSEITLTESATVEIKAQGILGDKHIEVYPGSPTDPELPNDAQILSIKQGGSMEVLLEQIASVAGSLKEVTNNLREATSADGTNAHILGRIALNIERLSGDFAEMTSENKGKISEIIEDVRSVTSSLNDVMNDRSDTGVKETWTKLSQAVKNLEEITNKINDGEGAIGKLVSDERTAENLDTAFESIGGMLDTYGKIQTTFDFRAEYLADMSETKTHLGIKVQPGLDRYYYIGVVDDPLGVVTSQRVQITDNTGGAGGSDTTIRKTFDNELKFTILFAKNFWDLTVRGGIIESTGGVGVDYNFFQNKLKFTVEAFDFKQLNLRSSVSYNLFKGIYITGGIHDALNKSDTRSGYLGAGLSITNDDIKLLMGSVPF